MKLDDLKARLQSHMGKQDVAILLADCREAAQAITDLEALVGELREALVVAVAEMSRARGRLETIAMCNEDHRIAAALGRACYLARAALTTPEAIENGDHHGR